MNRMMLLALTLCAGASLGSQAIAAPAKPAQIARPVTNKMAQALPPAAAPPAAQPAAPVAQPTAADLQKPSEVRKFDDWSMRCFAVQTSAPCDVFQMVVQRSRKQRILSASIAYSPPDDIYIAQFVMPWGVKLASGLTIHAGKYSSKHMAFRHCSIEGCFVEGRLDSATVDALSGPLTKATLTIMSEDGRRLDLPLSLKGFLAALDAMKTAAHDKAQ